MSKRSVGLKDRARALELPAGVDLTGQVGRSPAGRARIRYNDVAKQLEASINAGPYEAITAGGGGGGAVANIAALSALDDTTFDNAAQVAVASVRDLFELDKSSTLAIDGITVAATLSGTGRWVRRDSPSLVWASRDTWHINAITGDDENDGATAGTALATHAELVRRLGTLKIAQQVSVSIDSDLTEELYIPFDCVEEGGSIVGVFVYTGTPTTIRSSTFTANTQPWVYNPVGSRQDGQVEDTSLGGAGWELGNGRRLRVTSGAAADATSWVARDLGSDVARVAPWFNPSTFGESAGPSAGDSYEVQQLPTITGGAVVVGNAAVSFSDLYINQTGFFLSPISIFSAASSVQVSGCELKGTRLYAGISTNNTVAGCRVDIPVVSIQEFGRLTMATSVCTGRLETQRGAIYLGDLAGGVLFQNPAAAGAGGGPDVTAPVLQVAGGELQLNTTSHLVMYDMTNANATGMDVTLGGRADLNGTLWGRDNTMNTGVRVGSGSMVVYNAVTGALPDIQTPAAQDTVIGGAATAYGALPATNVTNFSGIVIIT